MVSNNEIDSEEFADLIADQKLGAEQFVNTQAVSAQAHSQQLTVQLLNMALTTLGPAFGVRR
jgi:hypothetical protein